MQMRSSSPEMAAKYQRERGTIASRMVTELCVDLQKKYKKPEAEELTGLEATPAAKATPAAEPEAAALLHRQAGQASGRGHLLPLRARVRHRRRQRIEDIAVRSTELETPLSFYVKLTVKEGPPDKIRYRCPALSNPTVLACGMGGWHDPEIFERAGAQPPRGAQVCKRCASVRPDVAAKVGKWQREDRSTASSSGVGRPKAKSRGAVVAAS